MASQFWIKTHTDKVVGPVSSKKLRELAAQGQLKQNHQISADQQKWVAARSVNGLTFQRGSADDNNHDRSAPIAESPDDLNPLVGELPPLDDGQEDQFAFPASDEFAFPANDKSNANASGFSAAGELPLNEAAPKPGTLWEEIAEPAQPTAQPEGTPASQNWGTAFTPGGQLTQAPASSIPAKPRPPVGVVITAISLGLLPILVFFILLAFNFQKLNYAFVGEGVVKARKAYNQIEEGMSMREVDDIIMAIPVEGEMQRKMRSGGAGITLNSESVTDVEYVFRLPNRHEECSIAVKFKKFNEFEKEKLIYKGKEGI